MREARWRVLVVATVLTVGVNVLPGSVSATATSAPRIYGWGDNSWGQLSPGLPSQVLGPALLPAVGNAAPVQVVAGSDFSLALLADGSVWSWGTNSYGQLGTGAPLAGNPSPPAQIVVLRNIV